MITANTSTDSRTVFLVDDDFSAVDLYSRGLEQAGFKTASVLDPKEAFEALPNLSADLIILDLMLPKKSGFELLEAIRSNSRLKKTPVLLLCNAYLPEMAQKALKAGGNKALSRSECTSSELISVSRELAGVEFSGQAEGLPEVDLAEQLKKNLLENGSSELAVIKEQCIKYGELARSEAGKEHLDIVYQSVRFSARARAWRAVGKSPN